MSPAETAAALADCVARIESLERRVVDLEHDLGRDIPWNVIATAVAAALPNGEIVAVRRANSSTDAALSSWCMTGRLILMRSHTVR